MRLLRRLLFVCALIGLASTPTFAQQAMQANLSSTTCPGTGCVQLQLTGQAGAAIQIQGTYVATIEFEGSVDGQTFTSINMTPTASTTPASSATANGIWLGGVGGLSAVRARLSAYTSGVVGINIRNSSGSAASTSAGSIAGTVAGDKTNNNAAPAATQLDVMPGISSATALSLTTGRSQKMWLNLFGATSVQFTNSVTGAAYDLAPNVDPCAQIAQTTTPISQTARTVIIAATSAKKNYICSIVLVAGAAEIANIDEGTGTTCQTGTAAIAGSTTAANGLSFAANGGMALGSGGATLLWGKTANVDTCLVPSGSNRLSGWVSWVQN